MGKFRDYFIFYPNFFSQNLEKIHNFSKFPHDFPSVLNNTFLWKTTHIIGIDAQRVSIYDMGWEIGKICTRNLLYIFIFLIYMTCYAINTTKMIKKTIKTPNIFIINQRFDVTDWKYLRISL